MFDIAWSELLLLAVIALIFIGPKELPQVLNNLGRAAAKLRRSADEFRRHFEESMRDSGYEDLHKNIQDLRSLNPSSQIRETIERTINEDYTAKPQPLTEQPAPAQPALSQAEPPQGAASGIAAGDQEEPAAGAFGGAGAAPEGAPSHQGDGEGAYPFEQWAPEPPMPGKEPAKDRTAPVV
jgi:sec-independent protein translocase protein TatB